MANNRMILVNAATGQRVFLATHLAAEWVSLAGVEDKLDQAFMAEIDEFSAGHGSTSWRIEYEVDETRPTVARAMIAEGYRRHEQMTPAPWRCENSAILGDVDSADGPIRIATLLGESMIADEGAVPWMRNHLGALLDGYSAALDRLEVTIAGVLP